MFNGFSFIVFCKFFILLVHYLLLLLLCVFFFCYFLRGWGCSWSLFCNVVLSALLSLAICVGLWLWYFLVILSDTIVFFSCFFFLLLLLLSCVRACACVRFLFGLEDLDVWSIYISLDHPTSLLRQINEPSKWASSWDFRTYRAGLNHNRFKHVKTSKLTADTDQQV